MYLACTEDDEDVEKIRERIEDAQYWANDVERLLTNAGLHDYRVDKLQRNITASRDLLDTYEEDEDEARAEATTESQAAAKSRMSPETLAAADTKAVAESKMPLLPSFRKGKTSEFKPEDLGPPLTTDETYSMIKDAKQYDRKVLAAKASQTAKEAKASGIGVSSASTTTGTTYDNSEKYHNANTAGAELVVPEYPEPSSLVRSPAPTTSQGSPFGGLVSSSVQSTAVSGLSATAEPQSIPTVSGPASTTLSVRLASPTLAAQAPEPEDKRVSRTVSHRLVLYCNTSEVADPCIGFFAHTETTSSEEEPCWSS